ncbi:glutamine-hydrolyzing GMP synthase [Propionibacterium australiense]|nr:glutamine-hydrolyzing GMP synthase [Propionibacterium australiense]
MAGCGLLPGPLVPPPARSAGAGRGPVRRVGGHRACGHPVRLRPVSSEDAMAADWTHLLHDGLARITNAVPEVNRVVPVTGRPGRHWVGVGRTTFVPVGGGTVTDPSPRKETSMNLNSNKRPDDMERITTPELADAFIAEAVEAVRAQVGDGRVLLALSGGVDSSVVAALLIKAIGRQLVCVHVNHGLMRKGESEQVVEVFRDGFDANLVHVDAADRFLGLLEGVAEPEAKRKIIGNEFINVFAEEAAKLEGIGFLGQGTIYPDILESARGVKAHHNVGGLPEGMDFELVEPVKLLYKDEVRVVGRRLGLPEAMVERQPFPGPGLGVRCLGAITRDRLEALREADAIVREEIEAAGLDIWQYFCVVPDMRATGVRDGRRAFDWPVIIRCVNTVDAMTAEVPELDWPLMKQITARILAEVPGVCRVAYDLTPKPVGTIEWE